MFYTFVIAHIFIFILQCFHGYIKFPFPLAKSFLYGTRVPCFLSFPRTILSSCIYFDCFRLLVQTVTNIQKNIYLKHTNASRWLQPQALINHTVSVMQLSSHSSLLSVSPIHMYLQYRTTLTPLLWKQSSFFKLIHEKTPRTILTFACLFLYIKLIQKEHSWLLVDAVLSFDVEQDPTDVSDIPKPFWCDDTNTGLY